MEEDSFEMADAPPLVIDEEPQCAAAQEPPPPMPENAEPPMAAKEAPKSNQPMTMASLLTELRRIQTEAGCGTDISEFLKPYLEDCLRRRKKRKPFVALWEFHDNALLCRRCFHPNTPLRPPHLDPMCATLCCGVKRCRVCLHSHKEAYCVCPHASQFFRWLEVKMK